MAKVNRVIILPVKINTEGIAARVEAGRLWNDLTRLHRFIRRRGFKNPDFWRWPSSAAMQRHFKRKYQLHSQTIQAIIQKFMATLATTRTNRRNGMKNARYPHNIKKYYNVIFKGQSIRLFNRRIRLPLGNRRYLWFRVPEITEKIVRAELGFNKLFITIEIEVMETVNPSAKVAALDFGLIHTAVLTDGENSLGIVGRGIRSIKQGHARNLARISRKISRTKKGSRRRGKLLRKKHELIDRKENVLRNAFHHVSRIVVDFCREHHIGTLVVGNLAGINRGKKGKRTRRCNQEIGLMEFGTLNFYLGYKLAEIGVWLIEEGEEYTSQTCPACGERNHPAKRKYRCGKCGYTGIRDLVGAFNIRNKYLHGSIVPGASIPPNTLKYLRPIRVRPGGRSSLPVAPAKVAQVRRVRRSSSERVAVNT